MDKKSDTTAIVASVFTAAIAGITIYALMKTLDTMRRFEEVNIDFGNDIGLLSMFNNKDNK